MTTSSSASSSKYPEPNNLITLAQIHAASFCASGWSTLLKGLGYSDGQKYDPERQITVADVLATNGLDDALWCLRVVPDRRAVVSAIMPAVLRGVVDCNNAIALWLAGGDISKLIAAIYAARCAESAAESDAERENQMEDLKVTFGLTS